MSKYIYGMRLRGFSIGCQPMNGLIDHKDGDNKYYDYLIYDRKLTEEELKNYGLDFFIAVSDKYKEIEELTELIKSVYNKYNTINFRWFAEAIIEAGYKKEN